MFQTFYPDEWHDSAYQILYEDYRKKGYAGILFDIDNTLVMHGAPASDQAIALFSKLRSLGFQTCLISNNDKERVEPFAKELASAFVFKAGKPGKAAYLQAMEKMKTTTANTLFVGDQLFTDVWGAKRCGIRALLVKPIDPREEIQIVLKRYLEKLVLAEYRQYIKKHK